MYPKRHRMFCASSVRAWTGRIRDPTGQGHGWMGRLPREPLTCHPTTEARPTVLARRASVLRAREIRDSAYRPRVPRRG